MIDMSEDYDFFEDNNNYTECTPQILKKDVIFVENTIIENTLSDVSSEEINLNEDLRQDEELLFNTKSHPSP